MRKLYLYLRALACILGALQHTTWPLPTNDLVVKESVSTMVTAHVGFHEKLDNKAQSLLRPEGLYVGELCASLSARR